MLKALYVTLISLGLALIFNVLFFEKFIGISVGVFVITLVSALGMFSIHQRLPIRRAWWLVALIIFFALMPGIRANEFLTFLNLCATLGLLILLAHHLVGTPISLMKLSDYFLMVLVPFYMLERALSTISVVGRFHDTVKHRDTWFHVFKGIVIALPILILFGVLFSQADLAFSKFIQHFIDIEISERMVQYTALFLFAFVASLSFLSYIFFPVSRQPLWFPRQLGVEMRSGRGLEVLVVLGLIGTLFLVFIGFQAAYLFGGEANIVSAGFTYAEYARRGFWELLAVSALSLGVLLASGTYAGIGSKKDRRFMIPALIMIAEVAIIMVSAWTRLSLYIDAYGMTELRFYAAGIIVLLSVLFTLLAATFIWSKPEHFFAFGTLLSVAGFIIGMNLINPDALIAQSNMAQYRRTGKIDVAYMGRLSADAHPWQLELYAQLEGEDGNILRELLLKEKERLQKHDECWQSINLSRARALDAFDDVKE